MIEGRVFCRASAIVLAAGLLTAGLSQAYAADCNADIGGLSQKRQSFIDKLNQIAKASKGKLDPVASCPALQGLVKAEAELIKYLRDSFDYSNRVLATLTANNALDRVEGRYAGPNTKLGISVIAVWHITDHYGQLVKYLRLNGIVPPFTQKYGVKVR